MGADGVECSWTSSRRCRIPAGTGVDLNESYIEQAHTAAKQRGLADRVVFQSESSSDYAESADLVLNVGSYQAFGTISEALSRLRSSTTPSGQWELYLAGACKRLSECFALSPYDNSEVVPSDLGSRA